MSKSIKLKNNNYWDSSGIMFYREDLQTRLDKISDAVLRAKKTFRSSFYLTHATSTTKITFPTDSYATYFVHIYSRYNAIKTLRINVNSSGNGFDISGDTTFTNGTITKSGLDLIITTTQWSTLVLEIVSLNSNVSAANVSITVTT